MLQAGREGLEEARFEFESPLAEGEGFEPPVAHHHGCFQDSCHQPDSAIPPGTSRTTVYPGVAPADSSATPHEAAGPITSTPPMYGRSASGTTIEPFARWYVSITASIVRGSARPLPFSVCTNCGGCPGAARNRRFARRAWKSLKTEHDDTSRYRPIPGAQASRSYFLYCEKPMSPVHMASTR